MFNLQTHVVRKIPSDFDLYVRPYDLYTDQNKIVFTQLYFPKVEVTSVLPT